MKKILLLLLGVSAIPFSQAAQTSYWVWQRSDRLLPEEIVSLHQTGAISLYWHYGTMTCSQGNWLWKERYGLPSGVEAHGMASPTMIPVIRLEPTKDHPFSAEDFQKLIPILNQLASELKSPLLQIDYEAPDRFIPVYQEFLGGPIPGIFLSPLWGIGPDLRMASLIWWMRSP